MHDVSADLSDLCPNNRILKRKIVFVRSGAIGRSNERIVFLVVSENPAATHTGFAPWGL
jgi:hypothetical protein